MPHIVVLGAGVVGLSTAILALDAGYQVTIVARDLPADQKTTSYTSPWAGAHHVSAVPGLDSEPNKLQHELDKRTWHYFKKLVEQDASAPVMMLDQYEYRLRPRRSLADGPDQLELISRFVPEFRMLEDGEMIAGAHYGAYMRTWYIDTPRYLPYLFQLFIARGGQYWRAEVPSLHALLENPPQPPSSYGPPAAVVNCTGLGSRTLGDVKDETVFPTRGQTVLIRAPWLKRGLTAVPAPDGTAVAYIIPRQSGAVILGGTLDANDWEAKPREETARAIMKRCLALTTDLLPPHKRENGTIDDLEVIEYGAGLRPTRQGGVRLDTTYLELSGGRRVPIVSNYGHGGAGYQSSWGSAERAVMLLSDAVPLARL